MNKVLLIDDDVSLCKVLSHQLQKKGYSVVTANSGNEGLELFAEHSVDIVLSDIQMPDISGIQVLQEIRKKDKQIIVIMITAYGSVDNALEACHRGADDYITKPFGQEQLLFVIEKALRLKGLQQENKLLKAQLGDRYKFDKLIYKSEKMENVVTMASRVAASEATVLILGESGTGKELLARAIHFNSPRKDKPFIAVNCPSIPDNLLESELFGHVKGAFTGAYKDRKGKFELAHGGSIFLDEIGDLKEDVQAKLLRVLQEEELERLGDNQTIEIDVRVIAATNKDLKHQIQTGRFREDLFYRLSVVPIKIPPLRERPEDIPILVGHFIDEYGKEKDLSIDQDIFEILQQYSWPGNVRELENAVQRAVVLADGNRITTENLPPFLLEEESKTQLPRIGTDRTLSLEDAERIAIQDALEQANGNQTRAAELLKIPRHVLIYRMKKLKIGSNK